MKGDGRSLRVAVIGDAVLNPQPGSAAERLLEGIVDQGWGLVQLAPASLEDAAAAAWRAHALEQVAELRRHAVTAVVVLAAADARESGPLRAAGLDVPDVPADSDAAATLAGLARCAGSEAP